MKKKAIAFILPMLLGLGVSAFQLPLQLKDTIVIGKGSEDSTTRIPKSSKGTIIRIELNGAFGGSGFQWENLTKAWCPVLGFSGSAREADNSVIGAPEKLIYFYCVRGRKGKVKLQFVLRRSWEKEKEPAQIFTHTVNVY